MTNLSNKFDSEIINFVYCIDNKFLIQSMTSIISLLDCIDEKINIYIIHSNNCDFDEYSDVVVNHKNLEKLEVILFNETNIYFPKIEGSHITEATYYRLFIEKYLPKDIDIVVYLDADTVCINNPLNDLKKEIIKLQNSNFILSAKVEIPSGDSDLINRLSISGDYFNAGVMILDLKKWRNENFLEKLIKKMDEIKNSIIHWDQDVLNSVVNGKFLKLHKIYNFPSNEIFEHILSEDVKIIHYLGSNKPWLTSGIFNFEAKFYQLNYKKLKKEYYHIEHKWKKQSVLDLLNSLNYIDKPIKFVISFIRSLY